MQANKKKRSVKNTTSKKFHEFSQFPPDFIDLISKNVINILENSSDYVIVLNAEGKIVFLNNSAMGIWGKIPKKDSSLFTIPQTIEKEFPKQFDELTTKRKIHFRNQMEFNPKWLDPPGPDKLYYLEQDVYGIFDNEVLTYYLLMIKNITDRHHLEQQILSQKQNLEKINNELHEMKEHLEREIKLRAKTLIKKELDLQYSNLISMISSTFLSGIQIDERMQSALRTLVEVSGFSFAAIIQNSGDATEKLFSNLWSWISPTFNIDVSGFIIDLNKTNSNVHQFISPEKNYAIFNVSDINNHIGMKMKQYSIQSLLIVPIYAENTQNGLIYIGDSNERIFSPREISMALQTAIIIGLAFKNQKLQIEEKLRNSEALIQGISNNLSSGMIYQLIRANDGTRKFTFLSDNVKKLYGITPAEGMVNSNLIYSRVFPEDLQRVIQEEEKANATLSEFRTIVRVQNPDGTIRWSSFNSKPQKLIDGSILWNGIEMDITDFIQIQNQLRESETRFHSLLEQMADGFILLDIEGHIVQINQTICDMVGYTESELLKLKIFDIDIGFTEEDLRHELKRISEDHSQIYSSKYKRKDKRIILVEINAKAIMLNSIQYILGTIREKK
jgi:PAS domain S-box-containing protein